MRTIGAPKSESGISEYLRDYPIYPGVFLKITDNDTRTFFTYESADDTLAERLYLSAAADAVTVFYKTRTILKELKNLDFDRAEALAYVGTLAAFERGEERQKIMDTIGDDRFVNLDGLVNFRLDKTLDGWFELGKLAEKLLKECVSVTEVQELVAFMLGMSKVEGSVRLICDTKPKIEKNGKFYPVAELTGNPDSDLVFSLLLEAPKSIVVPEPERFSEKVLSAIRALGE